MTTTSTAQAIDRFLSERENGSVVSVADAITYVRLTNPQCELLDDELANIIGWCAARNSCTIHFDLMRQN